MQQKDQAFVSRSGSDLLNLYRCCFKHSFISGQLEKGTEYGKE